MTTAVELWRVPMLIVALLATASTGSAVAAGPARPVLELRCHSLWLGRPDPEATVYRLEGSRLSNNTMVISDEKMVRLGESVDRRGRSTSWAIHRIDGHRVIRQVYWQRRGKAKRLAFTETFDFDARTVKGADGKDECNARGFAN